MSVLVFTELEEGKVKKASIEAASYAGALGKQSGKDVVAVALGTAAGGELESLGKYGVSKVLHVSSESLNHVDSGNYAKAIATAAEAAGAEWVIMSHNYTGKTVSGTNSCSIEGRISSWSWINARCRGKCHERLFLRKRIWKIQLQQRQKSTHHCS